MFEYESQKAQRLTSNWDAMEGEIGKFFSRKHETLS